MIVMETCEHEQVRDIHMMLQHHIVHDRQHIVQIGIVETRHQHSIMLMHEFE
jgi:hypothetical protein